MKCKDFTNDLISLAYGDIDKDREKKLRAHLKVCSRCRQELEELKKTSKVLSEWRDEEPEMKYVFVKKESFSKKVLESFIELAWPKKLALSFSAAAIAVLILLAAANTTISGSRGTWQISMRLHSEKTDNNQEILAQALKSYQKELIVLISRMVEDSEIRQQKITDYKLAQITEQFNRARHTDLAVLGNELQGLQKTTQGQFYKTNEVLSNLIQFASYQYDKQKP